MYSLITIDSKHVHVTTKTNINLIAAHIEKRTYDKIFED